jgi:hypothetical protein
MGRLGKDRVIEWSKLGRMFEKKQKCRSIMVSRRHCVVASQLDSGRVAIYKHHGITASPCKSVTVSERHIFAVEG